MKILIISDYYQFGGAEIYAQNLISGLIQSGISVKCLCFDPQLSLYVDDHNEVYGSISVSRLARKMGKFFCVPSIKRQIQSLIKKEQFDVIILNHEYLFCFSVLKAVKKCKVINIIHDYRPICHNSNCLFDNGEICSGYKENNCYKKCGLKYSKLHIFFKRILAKKMEWTIQKTIYLNIAPSQNLTDSCMKYGYKCICINNPIDFTLNNINIEEKKRNYFLYVGAINRDKGILKLCTQIVDIDNIHLSIVGNVSLEYRKEFKTLCTNPHIEYMGSIQHEDVLKLMRSVFCIIVPSLWSENYPTVILEAFAAGTLVLGSNRGGIKELLANQRGVLYDPLSTEDLHQKINFIKKIHDEEYKRMVNNGQRYLKEHNTLNAYIQNIVNICKE